jgi:hypothetical protein
MSWSRSTEIARAPFAGLVLCFLAVGAGAEDAPACREFKWPLATESAWLAANPAELKSGAAIDELKEGAFTVALKPSGEVDFARPPEGKASPDKRMGGMLSFSTVATPGTYQVTLSDEAWIDIVQNGVFRPSLDFSGVHGCPGMRKSVRFAFVRAPLVLQLSSASVASLKIAIRRLPQ